MLCPACVVEMPEEDLFCENCGLQLAVTTPSSAPQAASCLCTELDEDGFCLSCGRRAHREPSGEAGALRPSAPSDRIEQALSPHFAAVSDRGLRHAKNEDRFGIFEAGNTRVLVVCDGVSTSRDAELASSAVAEGVLDSLVHAIQAADAAAIPDSAAAIRQAITAGAARLAASEPETAEGNPPSTTVVAALVQAENVTVGWLGDSRAYWIELKPGMPNSAAARPLTQDHSWLNAVVGAHELTPEQAARSPQAHAITRWIGSDACDDSGELEIDVVHFAIPASSNGILLLCTDGLWNYFPTSEAMAGIVQNASQNSNHDASGGGEDALAIARQLVDLANRRGGHDNITAAVLGFAAPKSADPASEPETARKGTDKTQ